VVHHPLDLVQPRRQLLERLLLLDGRVEVPGQAS
jgi:hypothetical protein